MRDQLLILTSVASLFCVTASAAEWFVSPDGTDADGRGAETEPFRTINYAVGKASANDTIILLPGDHVEGSTSEGDVDMTSYPDWESSKVIHTGDDYCEFELVYPAFAAAGKMTCHVTLKRGERFFRCDVGFEHPDRFRRDFRAGPGIDLEPKRDHKGVLVEEPGLVSLFEDPKGANGSTMEAIFVADPSEVEVMTNHMNCRVLAFKKPNFTYWAGASWSLAGEITTPDQWHECVRSFQRKVKAERGAK